jgi:hypothetical protein
VCGSEGGREGVRIRENMPQRESQIASERERERERERDREREGQIARERDR